MVPQLQHQISIILRSLDLQKFLKKIPTKGIVFICNPNNPTGEILSKKNMEQIIKLAEKKSTLVFVDETFIELPK